MHAHWMYLTIVNFIRCKTNFLKFKHFIANYILIISLFLVDFKFIGMKHAGDIATVPLLRLFQRLACETTYPLAAICRDMMFLNIGFNRENFHLVLITFYISNIMII